MTEEIKLDGDATETETDDKGTGNDQTKNVRTFSQEDVNKVVAKEKAQWKKSLDKVTTDNDAIVTSLRSDLTKRDEIITKQIDLLKVDLDIDEGTLELLSEKDVLEQYDWLLKRVEKSGKKEVPRTPKSSGEIKQAQGFARRNSV